MKNTVSRALLVAVLTTSISAFASSEEAKPAGDKGPETTNCAATATADSRNNSQYNKAGEATNQSEREKMIEQQNKQWLHDLATISGG